MGEKLGAGFWVKLIVVAIGLMVAAFLSVVFVSNLFFRWGLFGGLIALGMILLLIGWLYDRREKRKDREYGTGA